MTPTPVGLPHTDGMKGRAVEEEGHPGVLPQQHATADVEALAVNRAVGADEGDGAACRTVDPEREALRVRVRRLAA